MSKKNLGIFWQRVCPSITKFVLFGEGYLLSKYTIFLTWRFLVSDEPTLFYQGFDVYDHNAHTRGDDFYKETIFINTVARLEYGGAICENYTKVDKNNIPQQ